MNNNWRNRPTTINYIPRSIDYVIAIDENGTSNLKHVIKAKRAGREIDINERFFTVTACIFKMRLFDNIRDNIMSLKYLFWKDALYNYLGCEKRVCLHSRDIRGKNGPFSSKVIDYYNFVNELSSVVSELPIKIFCSNIDKYTHVKRYAYPNNPYDLCMNFLLERIMYFIGSEKTCLIMLEARGKKEDKELLDWIKNLIDNGNNYNDSNTFSSIKGAYFNPKWCMEDASKKSYWELELADLCSYPIHKKCVYGSEDEAYRIIKSKIYNYPNINGYGFKKFP